MLLSLASFRGRIDRARWAMAKTIYCWRCKIDVPMLDEHEWQEVHAFLVGRIKASKEYRRQNDADLVEAIDQVDERGALARYLELTGFPETNANALWHHRFSLFGPACKSCGKPLRTPRARFCAECGVSRPDLG